MPMTDQDHHDRNHLVEFGADLLFHDLRLSGSLQFKA
jgi:hypothetical protein